MQQLARTVALAYGNLPRPHRVLLGSLTAMTLAVTLWRPYHPTSDESSMAKTIELELAQISTQAQGNNKIENHAKSLLPEASEPIDVMQPSPDEEVPSDELDTKGGDSGAHEYVVSDGDTLGSILTQYGIDMSDVALLARNKDLRNLKIGQPLTWKVNEEGDLQSLNWQVSRRETRVYQRINNEFKETIERIEGEWRNVVLRGKLTGSFVNSASSAGLTRSEINEVTKALQWQVDLKKLRKGDEFSVLMSREMLDGKREQSELQGVRLRTGGKDYYAFRAEDGKYYDRQGSGLAKGFLRYPTVKQYRISSQFNPRRLNPVTKRVAPHQGVDFALPVGSPVLAVGDGEVIVAKYTPSTGYYVAIRHGRQYTTRYMHLNKLLVKAGQKVKRGDRVALSGNTGRSTGPHLHYELWVNNQAVNPLTAKLPRTEGLTGKARTEYLAQVKDLSPQLQLD